MILSIIIRVKNQVFTFLEMEKIAINKQRGQVGDENKHSFSCESADFLSNTNHPHPALRGIGNLGGGIQIYQGHVRGAFVNVK